MRKSHLNKSFVEMNSPEKEKSNDYKPINFEIIFSMQKIELDKIINSSAANVGVSIKIGNKKNFIYYRLSSIQHV